MHIEYSPRLLGSFRSLNGMDEELLVADIFFGLSMVMNVTKQVANSN